jgi:hypothetical protein
MDALDHEQTSSYGYRSDASAYRAELKELIDAGRMRDAMAVEIRDIRRIAGSKYNEAIEEMLAYAKQAGFLPKPR